MNKYEAMFIFPETVRDEDLEAALDKVSGEIEKAGGKVDSTTRLGRRSFARPMHKQNAGQYTVIGFLLPGDKVRPLQARLKLNEQIFRVQIVRAPEVAPAKAVAAEA